MSVEKPRPRARRSIEAEEARAWVGFYRRAGTDPEIAAEVLAQLESDPEMKRVHLALYLRCRESLRCDQARQARNQRIGQFIRWLGRAVLIQPFAGLRRSLRHGADMAVACLPAAVDEPAQAQLRRLAQDAEFASAHPTFGQSATPVSAEAPAAPCPPSSRAIA
jgi:hypothetical protein